MSSEKERSDARTLRAVAHPVRLDLLTLLHREGSMTASRCAEVLGLTPKVCSYHLTQLARYGLIEETGEGKGRARPWRLAMRGLTYAPAVGEEPELTAAADQYARVMVGRDATIIETFIDHRADLPEAWRDVATMASNEVRLSPAQVADLRAELGSVVARYQALAEDPAPDSHPVQVITYTVPTGLTELVR